MIDQPEGAALPQRRRSTDKARMSGFTLGVIYAAWFLDVGHGFDTFAEDLLLELGPPIAMLQRIAQREEYHFKRGFWPELKRRESRRS